MAGLAIPDDLRRAAGYDLGARAAARWLRSLEEKVEHYAARWNLELDEVLEGGRLSLCLAGRDADGRELVLKLPTVAAVGRRELAALRHWDGGPSPALLRGDRRSGVLAAERLRPGTPLP